MYKFGGLSGLMKQEPVIRKKLQLQDLQLIGSRRIFNLVIKCQYYNKSTNKTFWETLVELREMAL